MDVIAIKQNNKKIIVDSLRCKDAMYTKKEISDVTGLSFATVSNLCNEMLEDNVLSAVKSEEITVGRSPYFLTLNYQNFLTLCLNLQMNGILIMSLLNLCNDIIDSKIYDVSSYATPDQILQFASHKYNEDFSKVLGKEMQIIGIGVAVSGIFDILTERLVFCAIEMFENCQIKKLVDDYFGLPSYVDNEANLCVLGLGNREIASDNMIYLHLSEGLGLGVICQGTLLRGMHGYGGEIAYTHLPIGFLSNSFVNNGRLEELLSVPGVLRNMKYEVNSGSLILEYWKDFVRKVEQGDDKALLMVKQIGMVLGLEIAYLVNLFDCDVVAIGGEFAMIYQFFEDDMFEIFRENCLYHEKRNVRIFCDINSSVLINEGLSDSIYNSMIF